MPHPIRIRINQKTKVPTKKQIKHDERSDWITVGIIDYSESPGIFSYLGNGKIWNDAQFAKFLLENRGVGEYTCIFWRKGMRGFRKFIQVVCEADGFYQKKRTIERPNSKILELKSELFKAKQEYQESKSESNYDDMVEAEKRLERAAKAQGPGPYLESLEMRYKFHHYEDYEQVGDDKEPEEEKVGLGFWSHGDNGEVEEEVEQEPEKEPEYSLW